MFKFMNRVKILYVFIFYGLIFCIVSNAVFAMNFENVGINDSELGKDENCNNDFFF